MTGDRIPRAVVPGPGFYALERHEGLEFRWLRSGALLTVTDPALRHFSLDIEAGPCASGPRIVASAVAGDVELAVEIIPGRGSLHVELPPGRATPYEIRIWIENAGKPMPGDARLLDARVFGLG